MRRNWTRELARRDRENLLKSYESSTGPVSLDVKMAKELGWSDDAIVRTDARLHALGVREAGFAKRRRARGRRTR
jgi:hypothetical protein